MDSLDQRHVGPSKVFIPPGHGDGEGGLQGGLVQAWKGVPGQVSVMLLSEG